MTGPGYTTFDTSLGRCAIAWGPAGIICVQLPEVRELETRRRLLRYCPDARDQRPPVAVQDAIAGIVAALRGQDVDLAGVALDTAGMPDFNCRVYDAIRRIPRGETRTYAEIAVDLYTTGAGHAVAHAAARSPFAILVPCHRALETAGVTSGLAGGIVPRSRLLAIEGALQTRITNLFDALLPVAPFRPQA